MNGPDLERLAEEIEEEARSAEPQVTPILENLVDGSGGRMNALETRFKAKGSIVRKMRGVLELNPNIRESRLKRRVFDAPRYTVVFSVDDYAGAVKDLLVGLAEKGCEFNEDKDVRNSWPKGETYKRINGTFRTRGGVYPFEVQFRTEESLRAKHESHPLYEQRRIRDTPVEQRAELDDRMREMFGKITKPPSVEDIGRVMEGG